MGRSPASSGPPQLPRGLLTTSLGLDPDPELELYVFDTATPIDFIWKHKILVPCSSYALRLAIWDCTDGKPMIATVPREHVVPFVPFGPISPIPGIPEQSHPLHGAGRHFSAGAVRLGDDRRVRRHHGFRRRGRRYRRHLWWQPGNVAGFRWSGPLRPRAGQLARHQPRWVSAGPRPR